MLTLSVAIESDFVPSDLGTINKARECMIIRECSLC